MNEQLDKKLAKCVKSCMWLPSKDHTLKHRLTTSECAPIGQVVLMKRIARVMVSTETLRRNDRQSYAPAIGHSDHTVITNR